MHSPPRRYLSQRYRSALGNRYDVSTRHIRRERFDLTSCHYTSRCSALSALHRGCFNGLQVGPSERKRANNITPSNRIESNRAEGAGRKRERETERERRGGEKGIIGKGTIQRGTIRSVEVNRVECKRVL